MRIAILTTDNREHHRRYDLAEPYFGPAVEALLQGLAHQLELEIHVISCTQKTMQSPEKLAENIWFHSVLVPKIGWLRTGYQGCVRAVRKKLRAIQPDLVHGQGTERDCAISAVFSGFPNVITIHGNMGSIARSERASIGSYWWWTSLLEKFTLPQTLGVFCNSTYTESLVKDRSRKTWLVPNAVRCAFFDTPLRARSASSKPILLNVGTIVSHKRQLELLSMAEELHRAGHSFELQFIGAADPRSHYAAEFLRRINASENQKFMRHVAAAPVAELIAALDSASALIHVPSEEAFGLVAAEALARNLKFFGTSIGGLRDIADGVEQAELFPLEDRDALRNGIARWLETGGPQPRPAATEMRSRYHPNVIAPRHLEIYGEVTGADA